MGNTITARNWTLGLQNGERERCHSSTSTNLHAENILLRAFLSSRSFHLRLLFFPYLNPELGDDMVSTFFVRIAFLCCFIAGMLCCARYSEDDLWYRAQVKSVERQNPLEVRVVYVDYGTTEVVNADRWSASQLPLILWILITPLRSIIVRPGNPWTLEIWQECLLCYDRSQQRSAHTN